MTEKEQIYTFLKYMMNKIEKIGAVIESVCFDFNFDDQNFGEDLLEFEKISNLEPDGIIEIMKKCQAKGFIHYINSCAVFIRQPAIDFIDRYENSNESTVPINIGTISGPTQIGNNNTQNVTPKEAVEVLLNLVDKLNPKDKQEAKTLLGRFIEHPAVNAVLSSAISAAMTTHC